MLRASITDSQIVKGYHCASTKIACILNNALAPYLIDELVSSMKQMSYSLSVDGSNDTGLSKMNPLTVRIDDVNEKVVSLSLSTGANASKVSDIFDAINSVVEKNDIPWGHCTAFGVDNTNTNIGAKNSIISRVRALNPSVYFVGCPCHIIHNAAQKGAEI